MKKTLLIVSLILVIGLTATIAYAQTSKAADEQPEVRAETNMKDDEWRDWHNERMEWKRTEIGRAVEDKEITKEQAKTWNEHFDYMEEFHKENGPMPGCHGAGHRRNRRGFGHDYGPGMRRSNE
ncbi:MAG: hypothetical protein GX329_07705 [Tissierellia bacterium]|nr:hypothetical protein [Tissierellia bacterium]